MRDITEIILEEARREEDYAKINAIVKHKYLRFYDYDSIGDIQKITEEREHWKKVCAESNNEYLTVLQGTLAHTTQSHAHENGTYSLTDYTGRIMAQPGSKEAQALLAGEKRFARIVFLEMFYVQPTGELIPEQEGERTIIILHAVPERGEDREKREIPTIPDMMPEEWNKVLQLEAM